MGKHFQTLKHAVWLPFEFSVGPVMSRFYNGLLEARLEANRCTKCSKVFVPPRSFCPECGVEMGEWVELIPEGTLETWTRVTRECYGQPVDPPFVVGLIRLDGADCNFMHLVGGFPSGDHDKVRDVLRQGLRVRAVWKEERTGHLMDIKYFAPCSPE